MDGFTNEFTFRPMAHDAVASSERARNVIQLAAIIPTAVGTAPLSIAVPWDSIFPAWGLVETFFFPILGAGSQHFPGPSHRSYCQR